MTKEISDLLDICLEKKEYKTAYKVLQQCETTYNRHNEYMEKLAGELITYYIANELKKPYEQKKSRPTGFGQV